MAQPVDRTGTGESPATTATAPNTTITGQTMPRGREISGFDVAAEQRSDNRTKQEKRDDEVTRGICIGCN